MKKNIVTGLFSLSVLCCVYSQCHQGWVQFRQSCYLVSTEVADWYQASSSCREHDSTLVEIESKQEDDYLRDVFTGLHGRGYWASARDDVVENTWEWSSGANFSYTHWSPGEPNGGRHENCLLINKHAWADHICSFKFNYVCEKESSEVGQQLIGK